MSSRVLSHRSRCRRGKRPGAAAVLATLVLLAISACATGGTENGDATLPAAKVIYPLSLRYHGIHVVSNVEYGSDPLQRLDVCLPQGASTGTASQKATAGSNPDGAGGTDVKVGTHAAIMMIHGGSWSHGDKATAPYRAVCKYFASQGFVVFNVDYRLAPTDPFPAGANDVRRALDWIYRPSTRATYDVDANRIGVFGGSAGGNLAALLAVEDHASSAAADGYRIRAVAELSGPSDLTAASTGEGGVSPAFSRRQLLYLGCSSYRECPAARRSSPIYRVTTKTTAPFFIGHSTNEFIPLRESTRFVRALRAKHVRVTFVEVRGTAHSIAQLDMPMSERIVAFFHRHLG